MPEPGAKLEFGAGERPGREVADRTRLNCLGLSNKSKQAQSDSQELGSPKKLTELARRASAANVAGDKQSNMWSWRKPRMSV